MLEIIGDTAIRGVFSTAQGEARKRFSALLSRYDPDRQVAEAWSEQKEEILFLAHRILIEFGRVVGGQELDGEEALARLISFATAPQTRHRFRAFCLESAVSTDERVAMLATGLLTPTRPTSLQERMDRAMASLFPDDAATLQTLVKLSEQLRPQHSLAAVSIEPALDRDYWFVIPGGDSRYYPDMSELRLATQSLYCLRRAACIDMSDGIVQVDPLITSPEVPPTAEQTCRRLEVLPIGFELARTLESVDWRELARRSR